MSILSTSEITYKSFIDNIIQTRGRHGCGDEYHEKHHIVPRCLGGEDKEENYIDLFAREHYEAHKLLALENPNESGLQYAWWMMVNCTKAKSNKRDYVCANDYEVARKAFAKAKSNSMTNKSMPEDVRKKIAKTKTGSKSSEKTKKKISEHHADVRGVKHPRHKPIICIETGEEFWGATEINKKYGYGTTSIRKACLSGSIFHNFHWSYADNVNIESLRDKYCNAEKVDVNIDENKKYIVCSETGKIYKNATEAAKATINTSPRKVLDYCKGKIRKRKSGYHWRYATQEEIKKLNKGDD